MAQAIRLGCPVHFTFDSASDTHRGPRHYDGRHGIQKSATTGSVVAVEKRAGFEERRDGDKQPGRLHVALRLGGKLTVEVHQTFAPVTPVRFQLPAFLLVELKHHLLAAVMPRDGITEVFALGFGKLPHGFGFGSGAPGAQRAVRGRRPRWRRRTAPGRHATGRGGRSPAQPQPAGLKPVD